MELDFFRPTAELERRLRWKAQLEDKMSHTPKIQNDPPENKSISRNVGNLAANKKDDRIEFFPLNNEDSNNQEFNRNRHSNPVKNLLEAHPIVKKRIEWQEQIQENTSIITDLKQYKLPPEKKPQEEIKVPKQNKDKDTEIYKIMD